MRDDPFYRQNDPTDPIQPPTPSQQGQQGYQGYQGDKLILGNFQNRQAQQRPDRRAYQNPQQQNIDRPPIYPQRQPVPPGQQAPPTWGPGGGPAPTVNPN